MVVGERARIALGAGVGVVVGVVTAQLFASFFAADSALSETSDAQCSGGGGGDAAAGDVDCGSRLEVPDLTIDGQRLQQYEQEVRLACAAVCTMPGGAFLY